MRPSLSSQSFHQLTLEPTTQDWGPSLNRKICWFFSHTEPYHQSNTCLKSDGSEPLTWRPQSKTLNQLLLQNTHKNKNKKNTPNLSIRLFPCSSLFIWPLFLNLFLSISSSSSVSICVFFWAFFFFFFGCETLPFPFAKIFFFFFEFLFVAQVSWLFCLLAHLLWNWPYLCLALLQLHLFLHLVSYKLCYFNYSFRFCFFHISLYLASLFDPSLSFILHNIIALPIRYRFLLSVIHIFGVFMVHESWSHEFSFFHIPWHKERFMLYKYVVDLYKFLFFYKNLVNNNNVK